MVLIFLSLGWLVGLYMGRSAAAEADPAALCTDSIHNIGLGLGGLAALSVVAALLGKQDRRLSIAALSIALGLVGAWRGISILPENDPLTQGPGDTSIRGTISSRPEPRDTALLFVLEVDGRLREGRWEPVRSRTLVRTDRYGGWNYGDRVFARGHLTLLNGGSGYWAEYLARQGIYTTLEYPQMKLEGRPQEADFWRSVNSLRDRIDSLCAILFPEPQASLLAGILVGARANMPPDFRDALNATGTNHIVAVSGFNVTVVAGLVQLVTLRYLARRKATLLAILAVWLYSLLTGMPPSATRAAIMCSLGLAANLSGRGGDALSFLCLSAALMTGIDPNLLYDLGFQLSFLATLGLVLVEPVLRGWLAKLPGWLSASLAVTMAAQLATLPIVVGSFHTISLVAPLTNLLIAPMLPGLMVLGALAVAFGLLYLPLGHLVAPAAWLYLTYLVDVISWTAQLPNAAISTGGLGGFLVGLYYLLLAGLGFWHQAEARLLRDLLLPRLSQLPRWTVVGGVAAFLSAVVILLADRPDGKVHVFFLDVGNGDAILIRGPEGHNLLVDGGPSPTSITTALGRRLGLFDRKLDAVVLTGSNESRLAGLSEAIFRQPIDLVVLPAPLRGRAGRALIESIDKLNIPTVAAAQGQHILLGENIWLEILWASPDSPEDGGSLVARLVVGNVALLLLGDAPRGVQAELVEAGLHPADVLMVPRRGAAGALDATLLQVVRPRVAVVSVGAGNRFGLPAESTLEMLKDVTLLRTDHHGTIELVVGRDGYELFTDR